MTSVECQQLVDFLGPRFTEVDRRFGEVNVRLTELRQEMLGHFDVISHRFERPEQEYDANTQALRRIEAGACRRARPA